MSQEIYTRGKSSRLIHVVALYDIALKLTLNNYSLPMRSEHSVNSTGFIQQTSHHKPIPQDLVFIIYILRQSYSTVLTYQLRSRSIIL